MDFYPLDLAGKTYRLRFTPDDLREICRRLTPMQTPGSPKVNPPAYGTMLVGYDQDAIEHSLMYGLRHMADYKKIDLPDVQKLINAHIRDGGQFSNFRLPIFRALVACGLAEFAPVLKILEDEEAKRVADSEADSGNAPTTDERQSSMTTSSATLHSIVVESDSST